MTQLFDQRTGVFTPLSDSDRDALPDTQRAAYDGLASACADLAVIEADIADAQKVVHDDVAAVREAEARQPRYDASKAFHNLWRETVGLPPLP